MSIFNSLASLGWQPFFQQQLTLEEWTDLIPARIIEQHKTSLHVATQQQCFDLHLHHAMPDMVVGDWLLLDGNGQFVRLLDRKSCFVRKAAGSKVSKQLISSNVDTAFVVSSMNDDFNISRIERFIALVHESTAEPVVILSKCDQADAPEDYVAQLRQTDKNLSVLAINCLDRASVSALQPWLKTGSTVAILGSSGVGKSTLVNTLSGQQIQDTSGIREDDAKGRHTTTRRSLVSLPTGALLLDTPGMREIQLVDCKEGIASAFADIESLAEHCRFLDCRHQAEPGCAVHLAIEHGTLEQRRLDNYLKLMREDAHNSASVAEQRAKAKALGKYYKRTIVDLSKLKGR